MYNRCVLLLFLPDFVFVFILYKKLYEVVIVKIFPMWLIFSIIFYRNMSIYVSLYMNTRF